MCVCFPISSAVYMTFTRAFCIIEVVRVLHRHRRGRKRKTITVIGNRFHFCCFAQSSDCGDIQEHDATALDFMWTIFCAFTTALNINENQRKRTVFVRAKSILYAISERIKFEFRSEKLQGQFRIRKSMKGKRNTALTNFLFENWMNNVGFRRGKFHRRH